jgi:hypothetical protein
MTTYRVLAEAAASQRHRLVAAFMSRSPDGRRMDPPRTGRCVIAGLVLAAVCLAAVGVTGAVIGHPDIRWNHDGIHASL